ncbi:hypothetical protein [[Clostridium] polysaccharolyticum]|uniref:DUF4352 domain-containing protein n=1 Tax=[Clostridium] polysaccharolyticum TaxID=29364 RepID=A0A1I0BEH5_9FIRM|nr:hypothetical protein [[Clostridium] polysaccharolyticum]SET04597.1 hypothetical protein SAMN04487772_10773 [[Clostridium] polysaccharolyticum]
MNKRKFCIFLAFSFLLTGCSSVTMTQTENSEVAEYIAYSLLKYHKSPDVFVMEDTEKKTEENEEKENQPVSSAAPVTQIQNTATSQPGPETDAGNADSLEEKTVTAGEVFGSKDFQISVKNKGMYESYPKNGVSTYFSLSASAGKKLLVLELKAKNTGNSDQIFKTGEKNVTYTLDGDNSNEALVTILEHDIHFVKETVKPGKSKRYLLFFEVGKKFDVSKADLNIDNAGKSVTLHVK